MLMGMSGNVWQHLEASGNVWEHQRVSDSEHLGKSGNIWERLGISGSVRKHLGAPGSLWKRLERMGTSGNVWERMGPSGRVWARLGALWQPTLNFNECLFSFDPLGPPLGPHVDPKLRLCWTSWGGSWRLLGAFGRLSGRLDLPKNGGQRQLFYSFVFKCCLIDVDF